jgi:hypothetical protein
MHRSRVRTHSCGRAQENLSMLSRAIVSWRKLMLLSVKLLLVRLPYLRLSVMMTEDHRSQRQEAEQARARAKI